MGDGENRFLGLTSTEIGELIEKIEERGYKAWLFIHSHEKSDEVSNKDWDLNKEVKKAHPYLKWGLYVIESGELLIW